MNLTSKSFDRALYWTNGIVLGLVIGVGVQLALAWTAPGAAPSGNNTLPPITVSGSTQTKSGQLNVTAIGDANDGSYYLNPNGGSKLNWLEVLGSRIGYMEDRDNTSFYVDPNNWTILNAARASYLQDRDDTNYYVDPNGWTILNATRISYLQDRDNTGYYVDPNSTSRFNYTESDNIYSYGWMQAGGNIGTNGYSATPPAGWGGGVHTWDVWAKSAVRTNTLCLGGGTSVNSSNVGDCRTSWPAAAAAASPSISYTGINSWYSWTDDGVAVTSKAKAQCPGGTVVVGGACSLSAITNGNCARIEYSGFSGNSFECVGKCGGAQAQAACMSQ